MLDNELAWNAMIKAQDMIEQAIFGSLPKYEPKQRNYILIQSEDTHETDSRIEAV